MKSFSLLLLMIHLGLYASSKEIVYTGSTPAHIVVRTFLGISLSDSVDFIRWKLAINHTSYQLDCEYGIGKPGTPGFINGGKKIKLAGNLQNDKRYYILQSGNKHLELLQLNADLLHPVDANNQLLNGTGGWSYTLSAGHAGTTHQLNFAAQKFTIKDSVTFHGRTPCRELLTFADVGGRDRYRLKWSFTLYTDHATSKPTTYSLRGTAFEKQGFKTGSWDIISANGTREIYRLDLGNQGSLYFIRPDENILLFTTPDGKLLVGDSNFSYTLNKKN